MPDFDLTPVDYDPFADASNVVSGVPVQQGGGRLTINPQRGQMAPEGLPPPQPTPPSIQAAMEHQQNWGMPSAGEQLGNIGASVLANPVTNIAQRGAEGAPQPPLSDDPAEMDRYQEAQRKYFGGNLIDTMAMALPQMGRAETGAAGIFGGKGAKTADLNKLVEAQRMEKSGEAMSSIWYQTGWGRGRDGQWRFEINDENSRFKKQPPMGTTGRLDLMHETMDHPDLYAAYPDLASIPTSAIRKGSSSWGDYTSGDRGPGSPGERIRIQNALEDPRSTMLHELQHAVQQREGFGAGGNPDVHGEVGYATTSGEVEARNVSKRQDYSADQRQFTPPWLTEDRPRTNQLVRDASMKMIDAAPGVWDYPAEKKNYFSADPHALIKAHEATNPNPEREYSDYSLAQERDAQIKKQPVPVVSMKNGRLTFESGGGTAGWAKDKGVGYVPLILNKENRPDVIKMLARHGDKNALNKIIDKIKNIPEGELTPEIKAEVRGIWEDYKRAQVQAFNEKYPQYADLHLPTAPEKPAGMELPAKSTTLGAVGSGKRSTAAAAAANEMRAPEGWISQRLPTGKNATENPFTQQLLIDSNAMRNDPNWEHHINLTRDYVNFAGEKERAGQANMPEDAETQYRRFVDHAKDNLRFIYDNYKQFRDRSKLWYDGANHIATAQAEKYGLTVPQASAVYAALSPQKDWFQNVSLGNRVMEIYHNHANEPFTPQMMETAKRIYRPTSKDPAKAAEQAKDAAETIKRISSGPLSAMKTTDDKAAWLRAYDETNFEPHYHVISPEGDTMELQTTNAGKPRKMAWGSLEQIGKAIDAIESGGDIDRISSLMGERHKVRNFYNNILHPNSPMGDVTIDTHAVAAAMMRPFSGNSTEVLHNFKTSPEKSKRPEGFVPSRGSAITGAQGTYGLYADAYRELAAELGLKPRELQSITWEGIRGLFPAEDKRGSLPQVVDQIWRRKDLSPAQKREMIRDQAGGFRPPDWHD